MSSNHTKWMFLRGIFVCFEGDIILSWPLHIYIYIYTWGFSGTVDLWEWYDDNKKKDTWICWLNDIILLMVKILHQLIRSLNPWFTRFYTSQVVVWDFWTINSISCCQYTLIHHLVFCYANQMFEGSKLCCQPPILKYKRYKRISQIIFSSASNYPSILQPELRRGIPQ